jgi:hypothetical protein
MLAWRARCGEKRSQRRRLVVPVEHSAAMVFPIHAEPRAVCAPLPGHRIIQMEAPAERVLHPSVSDRQARLGHGY